MKGVIKSGSDFPCYRFELAENAVMKINSTLRDGTVAPNYAVYKANPQDVYTDADQLGVIYRDGFRGLPKGSYALQVGNFAPGPFEFNIAATPQEKPSPPVDPAGSAATLDRPLIPPLSLTPDAVVNDYVGYPDGGDIYSFQLAAPAVVNLELRAEAADVGFLRAEVFRDRRDGTTTAADEVLSVGVGAAAWTTGTAELPAGEYLVRVTSNGWFLYALHLSSRPL